jgi:hypothetical protein
MASPCGGDPLACIDFVFLLIGEFLKDWTTMGMMALLLGLLLKMRIDQNKARDLAYHRQMESYDDKRTQEPLVPTWGSEKDKTSQA